MSRSDRLIERFKSRPADFEWTEMERMLKGLGYRVKNGDGSRRTFSGDGLPKIKLHEPHPSPVVKQYVLDQVRELLESERLI
jgi:hypothetical protein